MSKKLTRILNRRDRLELLAQSGGLYCAKHSHILSVRDVNEHRCYIGNHGRGYCKYLRGNDTT